MGASRARPLGAPLIVIPTYREAGNIEVVLDLVQDAVKDSTVLVIDDEGGDGTADIVEAVAARSERVKLVRRAGKSGLASAYQVGLRRGIEDGFDVVVGMDADLSHDPASLPLLLTALAEGADVVIGSRYVPGGSTVGWSLFRRVLSRAGNWYAAWALRTGVRDSTSAFRAYRVEALRSLDLAHLKAEGYGFLMELLYLLRLQGAVLQEVPISFAERATGKSKMSTRIALESLLVVSRTALGARLHRRRNPRTR